MRLSRAHDSRFAKRSYGISVKKNSHSCGDVFPIQPRFDKRGYEPFLGNAVRPENLVAGIGDPGQPSQAGVADPGYSSPQLTPAASAKKKDAARQGGRVGETQWGTRSVLQILNCFSV
jgi:hypothetical protein